MKRTIWFSSVMIGMLCSSFVLAKTEITGTYQCEGESNINNKPFKGTLEIHKHEKKGLYETKFTYRDGSKDVGILKPSKKENVYVQYFHSAVPNEASGFTRFTLKSPQELAANYVYISENTGDIATGEAVCTQKKKR
ncbi:hypothetical protein [Legionella impletisoli]|uniref:Uncharacterized protein n=1 Tax=Legionella impletisoli TaxID=343510 RepID=A0A917JSJ8_9GAMM|nr:hypothetical protein [Legionella impletisoli]GGI81752.1 hypothetical protein GCM10007966_07850 [Legionella impletisoli]